MQSNTTPADEVTPAQTGGKRITITLFPRGELARGATVTLTVAQLHQLFRTGSKAKTKAELGGWSPATYRDNHRNLANLFEVCALVLDIDNAMPKKRGEPERMVPTDQVVDVERAMTVLGPELDVFVYTSFRHKPSWPKFRVVIPLDRLLKAAEYPKFWAVFSGLLQRQGVVTDPNAKDGCRLWYLSSKHAEHFECFHQPGKPIEVDSYLALFREPPRAVPTVRVATSHPVFDSDHKVERARRYLAKCPPAVSGAGGHARTFGLFCHIIRGFDLSEAEAWQVLSEWNQGCDPPWSDKELEHKIDEARTKGTSPEIGCLLDTSRKPTRVQLTPEEFQIIRKARKS